jgi:hypothetical protein
MISKLWGVCRTQSCDPPRGLEIIWGMSNTVTSQLSGTVYPTCAWPFLILCTRSPTPAMILVAAHDAAPVSCTPRVKQVRFSTWTKIKVKPPKLPGFKFKPKRVDYSSQSNQGTDHLISQSPPWWVHWQHKSTKFEFRIQDTWSTTRRPKGKEKLKKVI